MNIDLLANHPQFVDELAPMLLAYWRPYLPGDTLEMRIEKLRTHLNHDHLPLAIVAHHRGEPMGTAALRACDLPGYEFLTPWLGGVFVADAFRGRGIGLALCKAVERLAWEHFAVRRIYLFTLDRQQWYQRQGWQDYSNCEWKEHRGTIMQKSLCNNDSMNRTYLQIGERS